MRAIFGAERRQNRPAGAWETTRKKGPIRRLTLRRSDGAVYLNRWGIGHDRIGGVLLHKMEAPDPGEDLHDHPWWFLSIILWSGYAEDRAETRDYERTRSGRARLPFSVAPMRRDQCHTVKRLLRETSWSLVVKGPRRGEWGFYVPGIGYMDERRYDETVRAERRDLWSDQAVAERTWADAQHMPVDGP